MGTNLDVRLTRGVAVEAGAVTAARAGAVAKDACTSGVQCTLSARMSLPLTQYQVRSPVGQCDRQRMGYPLATSRRRTTPNNSGSGAT